MSGRHGELTCQELVELVTAYLELRLPPPERARFEAHLGECPGCRVHLEQMGQTLRAAGTLRQEAVEPTARDALLAAFRDWKRGR